MWPGTLSIGSTSPRKRSRPRASTSSIDGDDSDAATAATSTAGTLGRATNDAGMTEPAQHPPQARRIRARTLIVGDDLLRCVDAQAAEKRRAGFDRGQRMPA